MKLAGRIAVGVALAVTVSAVAACAAEFQKVQYGDQQVSNLVNSGISAAAKASLPAGSDFTIGVLGDSRGGLNVLQAELQDLNQAKVSLVLYTGDLVDTGTPQEYQQGVQALSAAQAPILPAIGNHEQDNNLDTYIEDVMNNRPVDYAVDFGGWRFVTVDNGTGQVTPDQIQWLDQELATASPAIVFCHEPPYEGTWVKGFQTGAQDFINTLARHPNVKAAMFAHIHYYDHMTIDGIPYVVSGGAGAPLNKHIQFNAADGMRGYNYIVCHLGGDGTFSYQMVPFTAIAPDPNVVDTEDDIPGP